MKELELIESKGKIKVRGNELTLLGNISQVGAIAQDFTTVDNTSNPVNFSDYKGKVVILSIFPSIDTAVCAAQTREFNKRATQLSEEVKIIAVSKDLPFALGRFCAAEGINNIITSSDYKFSEFGLKYGFLIKENRLLARGVVVVGKDGLIKYVEYVPDIVQEPNYDKALEIVKSLI